MAHADNIYKNAVASLYNYIGSNQESEGLQGTCRGIYDYNTLTTDEAMIPIRGGDWYDGGLWENMYQHNWNANDISLYNVWKYLFKVIVLSNQSLSIIDSHKTLLSAELIRDFTAEVRAWLMDNGIEVDAVLMEKPPAIAYIDDRAICFDGHPEKLLGRIKAFVPWNKSSETNADRIRSMTDEELCKFLGEYKFCDICEEGCDRCTYNGDCDKRLLEWLQQPAETSIKDDRFGGVNDTADI